ncbi:reverse transcriptase domain-containing protein [Tanacetum coccineum]
MRTFWSLNEDILKIIILTTNTPYPSRKIRRIRACTHQRPQRKQAQYAVSREDQYAVLDIKHVNILEDIKRSPYSKKLQYAISNPLDTPSYDEVPPKSKNDMPLRDKRHFKTLSLDELRSPDFNLLSDQEYSEEEVTETMVETMEQYMSKTRADYRSGVARTKIEDKDNFELKGQFLKELRTNTFNGPDHEDANEHIEKAFPMSLNGVASRWLRNEPTGSITTRDGLKTKFMNKYFPPTRTTKKMEKINNFQQELDENLYQAWERFKELLMKCPQYYLTEMQETTADAKVAIQEMAEYSQKWHNGTSRSRSTETFNGLAAIQAQLNNLRREIKKVNEKVYATQVGCEQCKGLYYTKYCPLKEEGKTLEEAYYT